MAVDRVDDASEDRLKGLSLKGPEEVSDREIVGHLELCRVGDHDLYVPASVLLAPRLQGAPSELGEVWGDLDADDAPKGPFCGLVDNAALSAPEVHKGVALGDPDVAERSR